MLIARAVRGRFPQTRDLSNACDLFRRAPSRGGHGRRAAVEFVVCFGWDGLFRVLIFFFRSFFFSNAHEIPPHPKHIRLKMRFFSSGNSLWTFKAATREEAICSTCRVRNPQSSHAPPRRDHGGQNTCLDIHLVGVCRSVLSRKQWRLALSKLKKLFEFGNYEDQTGLGCELLYLLIN